MSFKASMFGSTSLLLQGPFFHVLIKYESCVCLYLDKIIEFEMYKCASQLLNCDQWLTYFLDLLYLLFLQFNHKWN